MNVAIKNRATVKSGEKIIFIFENNPEKHHICILLNIYSLNRKRAKRKEILVQN